MKNLLTPARVKSIVMLLASSLISMGCHSRSTGALAFVTNEREGTVTVIDSQADRVVTTLKIGGRLRGIRVGADKTFWVAISYPSNERQGEDKIAHVNKDGVVLAKYEAGTDPENFVVDKDEKHLYIANEDAGTASITDVDSNHVTKVMSVGLEPEGAAISPDGRWVYITSESSSSVSVIDTQTEQVVKTFLVGARPREAAFTADGSRAYVTAENGNAIAVVDVARHEVIKSIDLPRIDGPGQLKPKGIAVSPNGKRIYVATGRGNSVAVIDGESLQLMTLIPVGQRPWGLSLTSDGKKLYTANGLSNDVSVIDTGSNRVVTTIKVGDGPWGIAL
jgi:PQQ-dependent catabolism-associated beta-propeller protein